MCVIQIHRLSDVADLPEVLQRPDRFIYEVEPLSTPLADPEPLWTELGSRTCTRAAILDVLREPQNRRDARAAGRRHQAVDIYVLDTNAVDWIGDTAGASDQISALVASGRIDVLYTHVTVDELAKIPEVDLRVRRLLTLVSIGRLVPTSGFILDHSRLDHASLDDDVDVLDALRSSNPEHSFDALAAHTAGRLGGCLITRDRQLAQLCRRQDPNINTLTPDGFLRRVATLS